MKKREDSIYNRRESGFASGLLWGTILGAAGMLLFATKKGKKIRKYLSENGDKILKEVEEIYEEQEVEKKIKSLVGSKSKKKQKLNKDDGTQDLTHIAKIQERGRSAAQHFFTRAGKTLK